MNKNFLSVWLVGIMLTPSWVFAVCDVSVHGEALLSTHPSDDVCQAPVSIKAQAGASVTQSQTMRLLAPSVNLQSGFNVATGGTLYVGGNHANVTRFLTQATFGPTQPDIDHLVSLGSYEDWLDEQFAIVHTPQLPRMRTLNTLMCSDPDPISNPGLVETDNPFSRRQVWWESVLNDEDQLRQRVAFALSQILVVSDSGALDNYQFGMTNYWDTLMSHAFGNYRDLLESVTLHPMMGEWLSSIHNQKADPGNNTHPDENYARELLQLFSIGVHELNSDGTVRTDAQGLAIPTYTQREIKAFARVFTGLIYADTTEWWEDPWEGASSWKPMAAHEPFHDIESKLLLAGTTLPAGQDTLTDISQAMDNVFSHPNVAPFVSKQLIQRLVTSNPSPAYVGRVSGVFDNNGSGERGDLQAVVRAILLDPEARAQHQPNEHFGKLREPLLRFSHLWRAFGLNTKTRQQHPWDDTDCGQGSYELYSVWWMTDFQRAMGQDILTAPTVFNFYQTGFSPNGPVANAGLVAPEFQIATENWLTGASAMNWQIVAGAWGDNEWSVVQLDDEAPWGANPESLLKRLNILLLNGQMSVAEHDVLLAHLNTIITSPDYDNSPHQVVRDAILLIVNSPNYLIQK